MAGVLSVCTANICRSPMMEAAFAGGFAAQGLVVPVVSAGSRARGDATADAATVTVAAEIGLLLASHRSQQLSAPLIDDAELIVCAELDHLMAVVDLRPDAFARTFVLREAARRVVPRAQGEDVGAWVARMHAGRTPRGVMDEASRLGVDDPYRRGDQRIRAAREQITAAVLTVVQAWAS